MQHMAKRHDTQSKLESLRCSACMGNKSSSGGPWGWPAASKLLPAIPPIIQVYGNSVLGGNLKFEDDMRGNAHYLEDEVLGNNFYFLVCVD